MEGEARLHTNIIITFLPIDYSVICGKTDRILQSVLMDLWFWCA